MACGGLSKVKWSDRTYRIRDIVENPKQFPLPILVKLEEGIYGCQDSESFSKDDLIKLDSLKSISKVVACCVDQSGRAEYPGVIREDEHGYIERTQDLTIPLRYQGVVNIFHPEIGRKVYHSVSEMVKDFPRYVKITETFVSKNNITVDRESVIELNRIIPGKGLYCNVVTDESLEDAYVIMEQIILDINFKQRFLLIPDENDYTLADVVERFPLPQYVRFVKDSGPKLVTTSIQEAVEQANIFEGTVKIKRRVEQNMIIGHYKPPDGVPGDSQSLCRRTLVIIPLVSYTARELEVRVPIDPEDDDDYELVMAKNFSQKSIREEDVDGTIYVDFLKTPKTTFVHYEDIDEVCPPVPPRPKRPGQSVPDTPPQRPPRPESMKKQRMVTERKPEHNNQNKPPPRPAKRIPSSPGPVIPAKGGPQFVPVVTGSKSRPIRSPPTGASHLAVVPKSPLSPSPPSDSDSDLGDYEEIDDDIQPPRPLTDDEKLNRHGGIPTKEAVLDKVPEKHKFTLRSVHKELIKFIKRKGKDKESEEMSTRRTQSDIRRQPSNVSLSAQQTHPNAQQQHGKSEWCKTFESLESNDLYKTLTEMGLDKMAIICRDEKLNGKFFSSITDEQLEADFRLTNVQRLKFRKLQDEGWTPK